MDGVVPTNLSSIVISAPSGVDLIVTDEVVGASLDVERRALTKNAEKLQNGLMPDYADTASVSRSSIRYGVAEASCPLPSCSMIAFTTGKLSECFLGMLGTLWPAA